MPDIRQLRYFIALAETLHFGRAAERLNLTQPPLSRQIMALEKDLGVRLVDRHSRHVRLTQAGLRFVAETREIVTLFDRACRNARRAASGEIGELSLGFMMHAAQTIVPKLARRVMTDLPGVELRLREVMPNILVSDLMAGQLDLGVMFPPPPVRGLEVRPVYRERLCVVLQAGHELAARSLICRDDLVNLPLILTPAETAPALRNVIEEYCHAGGFRPTIRVETQLQTTIVSLAAEGIGAGLVPVSVSRLAPSGVQFCELEEAPTIDHVLAWCAANMNPSLKLFLAMTFPESGDPAIHR